LLGENYYHKTTAALFVLRYNYSKDITDMETAESFLAASLEDYKKLAALTDKTYHYANSMHTSQRKIPVPGGVKGTGTNYLWSQLVPLYKKELEDFQKTVAKVKTGEKVSLVETNAPKVDRNIELAQPGP
jgi:hypothetical protein